ncbi:unnamed protein product, partial [Mesorhabditis belari]|uniref:Uncharacterized protein n=1 Tax=Mesorhabditis belari TaxID=2138241 RepID=A0AAF3FJX9_9BILA
MWSKDGYSVFRPLHFEKPIRHPENLLPLPPSALQRRKSLRDASELNSSTHSAPNSAYLSPTTSHGGEIRRTRRFLQKY